MAEGFELYHIPQQSRREKLRVVLQDHCNFPQDLSFIQNHDQAPFQSGDFVALSLSSQNTHNGIGLPVGLDLQSCGGGSGGDFGRGGVMTHGPYTGYALVLKGSKFLKPTQQLLEGICDVGFGIYAENLPVDCGLLTDPHPLEDLGTSVDGPCWAGVDKRKRSTLISLLDEVYKKYKQYYQQIQAVITSFETVGGLSNAAPFANLDIKAMLKHFHYLKNAITEQIQCTMKPQEHHTSYGNKDFIWSGGSSDGRMAVDNMGFVEHQPVWRLQRGLPKRAVKVLRSWLFDHFLHPYPTDTDKQSLAKQTGLSRNQVSNWFINARVRVWKPMVEEVHTLETRQAHRILSHAQQQETSTLANSFSSHPMSQEPPLKRTRNDIPSDDIYNDQLIMEENKKHLNFYDNLSIHRGNSRASGNRGVPLMPGLRQNNNVYTFSEKFPLNARGSSERFIVGGLNAQNRQLGQEIIGGRFLHDFGG